MALIHRASVSVGLYRAITASNLMMLVVDKGHSSKPTKIDVSVGNLKFTGRAKEHEYGYSNYFRLDIPHTIGY